MSAWLRYAALSGLISLFVFQTAQAQRGAASLPSPAQARLLSTVGTVAPIVLGFAATEEGTARGVLVGAGIILGPALGYIYGQDGSHGLKGAGVRVLITGGTVGAVAAICATGCNILSESDSSLTAALLAGLAGSVLLVAHGVRDIGRVDDHVQTRNRATSGFAVRPTYSPESGQVGIRATWGR